MSIEENDDFPGRNKLHQDLTQKTISCLKIILKSPGEIY